MSSSGFAPVWPLIALPAFGSSTIGNRQQTWSYAIGARPWREHPAESKKDARINKMVSPRGADDSHTKVEAVAKETTRQDLQRKLVILEIFYTLRRPTFGGRHQSGLRANANCKFTADGKYLKRLRDINRSGRPMLPANLLFSLRNFIRNVPSVLRAHGPKVMMMMKFSTWSNFELQLSCRSFGST